MTNTQQPLVSILCPLYNHFAFIADAIASIQAQTWDNWELIVVDDASTDQSANLAEQMAATDSRIKLFRHEQNQGISLALQTAWQRAQGQFIAMLGSDDRFMPDKLALQMAYLDAQSHIGAVFGQAQAIDAQSQPLPYKLTLFDATPLTRVQRLQKFLTQGNHLVGSSIMVRQPVLQAMTQPFNPCFHQLEDYDRNFKLALITELAVLPNVLVQYRQHAGNISKRAAFTDLRTRWETVQVLLDVARHLKPDDALAAFAPTHKNGDQITHLSADDVPYVLAQAALQTGKFTHRLFALQTLATGVGQPAVLRQWQQSFGFTTADYYQLTGLFDFYEYEKSKQTPKIRVDWQMPLLARYAAQFRLIRHPR